MAIATLRHSALLLFLLAANQSCAATDRSDDTTAFFGPVAKREQVAAAMVVGPGDDVQAALDGLLPGEVLRMAPGRYVGLSLVLRRPGVIIEAAGAEMDGATFDLAGEALDWRNGRWSAGGLPASLNPFPGGLYRDAAAREAPTAELQAREDLYVCEGERERCVKYRRRPPSAKLGRGEYATDSDSRRLLVCPHWEACGQGNDWAGRLLLLTDTPEAITCTAAASGVTIRGLTVRRYAPPFHRAQVDTTDCVGMRLEEVSILESHAIGWWAGDAIALRSHFDHNGQLGVEAAIATVRFEGSTCNFNNTNLFPNWNAGGCKFFSSGLGPNPPDGAEGNRTTWIGGEIVGNNGNGFWADGSALDPVVRGALVANNTGNGVHLELTYGGLVENNVFRNNGLETDCSGDKAAGSGVLIQETEGAVVRNNVIYVTTPCGRGVNFRETRRAWSTQSNQIVDNVIVQVDPGAHGTSGFWILAQPDVVRNNVIDRNTYVVAHDNEHRRWRWQVWKPRSGGLLTFEQWQREGYDRNGRVLRVEDPAEYVKPAND